MTHPLALTVLAQAQGDTERIPTPTADWIALGPLCVLVGAGLLLLLLRSIVRVRVPRWGYAGYTIVACGAAALMTIPLWDRARDGRARSAIARAIQVDGFSVFLITAICAAIALAALIAEDYLRREGLDGVEFYVLSLLCGGGAVIMVQANDLVVLFLGLEVLSIALYILAAFHLRRAESQEAGIKYFVLGAFSSAIFLYGIALVYGATGSTNLEDIATYLGSTVVFRNGLLTAGLALMLVGLGFKVAAVPFHFWTPDVYQGAPTPATGFMAATAKAAGFAGLLRVFTVAFTTQRLDWQPLVWTLAVLSMVVGSILAVVQTDIKRMLAYSSISHAGFIMIGLQAGTNEGVSGSLFYLLAYTFIVLGTFAVVTVVGRRGDAEHSLDAYRGLAQRRPVVALCLTLLLLAQAGVPLTSGFIAKFGVIAAAVKAQSYAIAIIAMLAAVIAAFFYLRVILVMYTADPAPDAPRLRVPLGAGVALAAAVGFTLFAGLLPHYLLDFANAAVLAR